MSKNLEISEEGLDVLDKIFKAQEAEHKMIDGWEHNWRKDAVVRAEKLIEALDGITEALESMSQVGMVFPLVVANVSKAYRIADKILSNAQMKLEVHEKVYDPDRED